MLKHQAQLPIATRILGPPHTTRSDNHQNPLTRRALQTATEVIQLLEEENYELKGLIADMKQTIKDQEELIATLRTRNSSQPSHTRQGSKDSKEDTIIKELRSFTPDKEPIVVEAHPTFFSFSSQRKEGGLVVPGHVSRSVILGGAREAPSKGLSGYVSTEVGKGGGCSLSRLLARAQEESHMVEQLEEIIGEGQKWLEEAQIEIGVEQALLLMGGSEDELESQSLNGEGTDYLINSLCECITKYRKQSEWLHGQLCRCLNQIGSLSNISQENKELKAIVEGLISYVQFPSV